MQEPRFGVRERVGVDHLLQLRPGAGHDVDRLAEVVVQRSASAFSTDAREAPPQSANRLPELM